MTSPLPPSAQRVQRALEAAGLASQVVELPQSTRTAVEAAAAVGCEVAQIIKSLVFRRADTGAAVLILASGPTRVEEAVVAAELGTAITKADADFVRAATGYAIGGVPPLGHDPPLQTLIDEGLLAFDTLWAAAGTPRSVFALRSADLVALTGGQVVRVAGPSLPQEVTP